MEYKKLSDGQMPGKEMREWKTLFKEGVPLFPPTKQSSATTLPLTFSSYEAEVLLSLYYCWCLLIVCRTNVIAYSMKEIFWII